MLELSLLLVVEQVHPVVTGLALLAAALPPLPLTARLAALAALAGLSLMRTTSMAGTAFPRPEGHLLHQAGLSQASYRTDYEGKSSGEVYVCQHKLDSLLFLGHSHMHPQ